MKKLILLITLLLVSWKSTSQQDTVNKSVDSVIQLRVPIAKLVIKDLIKGDSDKEELEEVYKSLKLTSEKSLLQDEVIKTLNNKVTNLEVTIQTKEEQLKLTNDLTNDLIKELKSEKRKKLLYKVGTGVGIVTSLILLVSN